MIKEILAKKIKEKTEDCQQTHREGGEEETGRNKSSSNKKVPMIQFIVSGHYKIVSQCILICLCTRLQVTLLGHSIFCDILELWRE